MNQEWPSPVSIASYATQASKVKLGKLCGLDLNSNQHLKIRRDEEKFAI